MLGVRQTDIFQQWLSGLRDFRAKAKIQSRIVRMSVGNFGDVKPVGEGISEMRIDHGPGYRVYFVRRGKMLVLLLCGGNKSTQTNDIKKAQAMVAELEE